MSWTLYDLVKLFDCDGKGHGDHDGQDDDEGNVNDCDCDCGGNDDDDRNGQDDLDECNVVTIAALSLGYADNNNRYGLLLYKK